MLTETDVAKIYRPPANKRWPVIVSVPHCGTLFPAELAALFHENYVRHPDDTDWFVDQLYDFVVDMGMTLVVAKFSRYVIDLNRSSQQQNLYEDQRKQTALCPSFTFAGLPLYQNQHEVTPAEVARRLQTYYWPYHHLLEQEMAVHLVDKGRVLLFDAHSIARSVPQIRKEPFPDVILGDNEGKTCARALSAAANQVLESSPLNNAYNETFRGGQITRYWGRPHEHRHALQLEMSQDIYMDSNSCQYMPHKAERVRQVLKNMFATLHEALMHLP